MREEEVWMQAYAAALGALVGKYSATEVSTESVLIAAGSWADGACDQYEERWGFAEDNTPIKWVLPKEETCKG